MSAEIKRVLVIAYIFPPTGGAGVQRVTKFIKYLPQFGWRPSVLTVANPSVPLFDESLLGDIPADTIIRRAKTWEPAYALKRAVTLADTPDRPRAGIARRAATAFARKVGKAILQPDSQILWVPPAIREGKQLLGQLRHHAILATAPPFSTFLVGASLSRHSGLPLILDYRDEWDLTNTYSENQRPDRWSRLVQRRMQHRVVRAARALVSTTRSSAQALEKVRSAAGGTAEVTWIYNGYDPDDFPDASTNGAPSSERYRLVYVGTLWNLTSAAPLMDALRLLAARRPELARRVELVFAGRRIGSQSHVLDRLKDLPYQVLGYPYVPHSDAVNLLHTADALCVFLSDVPGAGRVVPAKFFEYLAVKRPILAIIPKGELWDLLESHPAAFRFAPTDVEGIADCLAREVENHPSAGRAEMRTWQTPGFDRRSQTKQLAGLLDSCS
jgi:glycosyltransferase involved in cell wall biosynthesis